MVKNIKTFKLENAKIVFENRSSEYILSAKEQDLIIPSNWKYNKKIGKINVAYQEVKTGFTHFGRRFAVVIQRGWFRDKAVLFSEAWWGEKKIASKPLPVVANVGYNSNTYFTGLVVVAVLCLAVLWKKFYKRKK